MADTDKPIVVVTGAGSRDGRCVSAALSTAYEVIGMDRRGACADVPLIPVDLAADTSVGQAVRELRDGHGGHLAGVIHLPGTAGPREHGNGTRRLLEGLARLKVDRFVLASSMFVSAPGDEIDEDAALDPQDKVAQGAAEAEQAVRDHAGAIPFTVLRLARSYDDEVVDAGLARQIIGIRERTAASHLHAGTSDTRQAMLHRDDFATAVRLILAERTSLPRELILMLGEPNPPSYQALQNRIGEELHGEHWRTLPVPEPLAAMGSWVRDKLQPHLPAALGGGEPHAHPPIEEAGSNYVLDIARARALLGWMPRRRIVATLPFILRRLKRSSEEWYERNGIAWQEASEKR